MNKKILKINSWILIIIGILFVLFSTICMLNTISEPSEPGSFDDLGKYFMVIGTFIVYLLSLLLIVSGKGTLNYLKGKKIYKIYSIFNVIGIIAHILFIVIFILIDILDIFTDYYTGYSNIGLKIIYSIICFCLFVCPLIINYIVLHKDINEENKVKDVNIENAENNTYSYSDFNDELKNRKLIYELPENKSELTSPKEINALDSSSKYGYQFSSGSYTDSFTLSVDTDKKFPLFVYDSYTSLIKKSDKTADYYYIGPEDWYVNWYIYYIDGKIYAAIGEESAYGSGGQKSLSTSEKGIVVSEEKDITIYNSKKNYFVKGGGILDTKLGTQRSSFPTTTDIYNKKCMKITTVNKVNAETLDEIAKKLVKQK